MKSFLTILFIISMVTHSSYSQNATTDSQTTDSQTTDSQTTNDMTTATNGQAATNGQTTDGQTNGQATNTDSNAGTGATTEASVTTGSGLGFNPFVSFDIVAYLAYCSSDADCTTALGTGATCIKAFDTCADNTKFCDCGSGKTLYQGACVSAVTSGAACQGTTGWNMTNCDSMYGLKCGSGNTCECETDYTFSLDSFTGTNRCRKAKKGESCTSGAQCGTLLTCVNSACACPDGYFEDATSRYGCVAGHSDDKCAGSNANKTCNSAFGYNCDGNTSESKCTCANGKHDQTLDVELVNGRTELKMKVRACTGTASVTGTCSVDFSSSDGSGTRGCDATSKCQLCPPPSGSSSRVGTGTCTATGNGSGGGGSGAGAISVSASTVALATILAVMSLTKA